MSACERAALDPQVQGPAWSVLVAAAARLGGALARRGQRVATAESCTGGLIAALLTESPGSSAWFDRGFVTYSNAAKIDCLGVPEDLLARFGAVSEPVVRAMAIGTLARSDAALAIAVSGVAGPGGGSPEKPVGTVCVAWAHRPQSPAISGRSARHVIAASVRFPGDRQAVRLFTARLALCTALDFS